jgi:N-acetylglucosaminyl-diphospho-decaprenol L-rhamnosyltransferase
MSDATSVTAVIVTYNSSVIIDECLAGLVGDPQVEVVVVDSGSSDGSADRAASYGGVEVLAQTENLGWSACSNLGAQKATGRAVAFVNPDTRVSAEKLLTLAARLGGDVAAISPRFVNEDGSGQNFYFRLPSAITGPFLYLNSGQRLDELMGRPVVRRHLYGERLPVTRPAHAGAACMVVDREEFSRLGGFDERMWVFFSDVDFSRRLTGAGKRLFVDWTVPVSHIGGASAKALELDQLQLIVQRDYVAYSRIAFGAFGQRVTVAATWAFSGLIPAAMAVARGDVNGARGCIERAKKVLQR